MRKQWLVILMAVLASAILWGCGSSGGSGGSEVTGESSVADAENVGNCTICHTVDVHTDLNVLVGINPDEAGLGSAITHDCEACHGGGQYHHGDGPIPYPEPDIARCATCHEDIEDNATLVLASKHNYEDSENTEFVADGHDTRYCQRCHTAEGSVYLKDVIGDYTYLRDTIVAYGTAPGDGQVEALQNEDADGNPILHSPGACFACHSPLTAGLVTFEVSAWDPNENGMSDQFDMCTSCHNYSLSETLVGSGQTYSVSTDYGADELWFTADDTLSAGTDTAAFYHYTSWYRTIASTHYDNPDSSSVIEGYNIRTEGDNPCFDCHGHELYTNTRYADTTDATRDATSSIHTQWAQSAHAGHLLEVKYSVARTDGVNNSGSADLTDSVMSVGVTDETGPAWSHYNWDQDSRQACQMCHTATGAANFLDDPVGYDATSNDFSHLVDWSDDTAVGSAQNELLYCWGCHSDAESGDLRDPGSVALAYTVDDVNPEIPDLGNSNVCVNCHSGRGNMDSLIGAAAADPAGAAVTGGTSTHYLAAGATIFQSLTRIGYEYAGASYADKSYFAHNTLGCAECHMASEESHSYEVVTKDDTDEITAINSTLCVSCHDGEHALFVSAEQVGETLAIWNGTSAVATVVTQDMADEAAEELEVEAVGYHNALEALAAVLTDAGTTPVSSYPYFSGSATDQGHGGAMHNYSYLHHEPGAYAHNRFYTKRLIFDSIDWLTSGAAGSRSLDGSITLDTVTYADAIAWLGGDAGTGVIDTRP